ncbi:helix-turn-helix domain-containing protein [Variovorax sp. S2]|uniref:helix-turn-helix domain-containing protein n=1 Tax=Variovorax sp. S12S4 TaxID=3029170 RepID=UPI00215BAD95|nr:helix-turn-helix domain-containing protein [Variovorax sp. S12S4]MCR8960067.1 helix-turn-helix domain-containing protein [Variovorax sp. S12S4]
MDSLIAASARALAAGDALGALKRVALRDDPPALALRGIAMAQLGEHPRARELLRRAARGFGAHEELARARCLVAEAEVALAMRDLGGSPRSLAAAAATLEAHADHGNALQARLIAARKFLLLGRLDEAAATLAPLDARGLSPSLAAVAELTAAELALRSLRTGVAQAALDRAHEAAERARVPALLAEVAEARAALDRPAARRRSAGGEETLRLHEVEALLASDALVVDACRRGVGAGDAWRPLARRPVLFALARALAEAWPGDVDREALIAYAFNTRYPDETLRARLRVEVGRLRALVAPLAGIEATARGFVLKPHGGREVAVLAPPIDGDQASLLALLSDGAAWSTSALALALGASQRTVQRALAELETAGRVRAIGRARAQRWLSPPLTGFTTILLLPAALPIE